MRKAARVLPFRPSELVTPVILLVVLGTLLAHYFLRNAREAAASERDRMTREIFECEPGEALGTIEAAYLESTAHREAVEQSAAERPQAVRRNTPFETARSASEKPTRRAARQKPARGSDQRSAKRSDPPKETASAGPGRLIKTVYSDYDKRCQRIMDDTF